MAHALRSWVNFRNTNMVLAGVVPALAAREHTSNMPLVLKSVLDQMYVTTLHLCM